MRDITSIQEAFVADHIAALRNEGSALRSERERDHLRAHAAAGTDPIDDPIDHATGILPRRVRIGRWLVAVGEAIAGSARPATRTSRSLTVGSDDNDPCGDGQDRLVPAA